MSHLLKVSVRLTHVLISQLRASARVMLAAALLAPLAILAPHGVPGAAAQLAIVPRAPAAPNSPQTGSVWTALPNGGLNGNVSAFAVCGGQLYVGGLFQATADNQVQNLNNIARLNTTTQTWSPLAHTGLDANVFALACHGTDLYVGGYFTQLADLSPLSLHKIAKYNTTTDTWSALPHDGLGGEGASDSVNALAVHGDDLFAGGFFIESNDTLVPNLNHIARYSTTGDTWFALPDNGLNNGVNAIAFNGNDMYVGGVFGETANASLLQMGRVGKLSGGTWSALPDEGLVGDVQALAFNGADLYVGGTFAHTANPMVPNLNNLAKFSTTTSTWSAVADNGLNGSVSSLAFSGGDLYVGGLNFSETANSAVQNLNHIARYSSTANTWSALPRTGLNNQVHALLFIGSDLYVGGLFTESAADRPAGSAAPDQTVLNYIAMFTAAQPCSNVSGNVAIQSIQCSANGNTITVSSTTAQFENGDVALNVTQTVNCGALPITSVRVLTPDGENPPLTGPLGATSGVFAGTVQLRGASGPLDLKVLCGANPTPISTLILNIIAVVLPPDGSIGFGTLNVRLANAAQSLQLAQVVLYYQDPALGDVVWNANAYNQLNPQLTTAAAGGAYGWEVPGGKYFIKVSAPCYQNAQSSVVTVPPDITNLDVTLTPVAHCSTVLLPLMTK